ncbi:MFS transporter [Cohnella lubricantis]|uniref:MFS transporter n=1 Tax=Cohnella lubricantis TaxID=2163172 RepID=UPI0028933461|nr:MFS transporter [Cohnella lubricantis]MBP2119176.1 MFS family permease [Cohnella lubricantis]
MRSVRVKSLFSPEMSLFAVILYLVEFGRGAALISFIPIYGKNALGLNLDVIGLAVAAHYLTDTVVKLAIGYLMNRLSVRTIVVGALLLSMAGMLLMGFTPVPWIFIAASGLFGIGISPIWIVCLTRVRENRRGTQMGVLYTIWLVGLGSGPAVTNFTLEIGAELTFWIMAAVSAAALLLSLFIPREVHAEMDYVPFRRQLAMLGDRLKEMNLLLPGMVLQTLAAGMLVPILPSFAEDYLGLSHPQYSLLLLIGGGCTAAGLIPMGRLSDNLGKKWFLVTGFCLFGLALCALTGISTLGLSFAWALVLGVAYAAVLPAWNALLAAYVPPGQQGLGWGVFSTVEGIGGLIGPGIGGILAEAFGEPSVVRFAGFIFIAISLMYMIFPFRTFRGEGAAGDTAR